MNHGVIEQVGSPTEIYSEPASVFVADFIGTMNFIAAEVAGDSGVGIGGLALACDTSGFSAGERVTVAIRPEDISLEGAEDTATADRGSTIDATVDHLEFLGSFVRAGLVSAASTCCWTCPSHRSVASTCRKEAPCGR